MEKVLCHRPIIKLMGLSVRTNNKNEMNPQLSKIAGLASRFDSENFAEQIPNRVHPGVIFAVYTEYDSNEHGDYTFFIGEEVTSFDDAPVQLQKLSIPAAKYQKFTTESDAMPKVVIDAWQEIWKMSSSDLGGIRTYQADFEIYDQRAKDPASTILDIYIGIE